MPNKTQTFKEAFAANRKAGKKEFTWNNKKYHTFTKEEEESGFGSTNKRGAPARKKVYEHWRNKFKDVTGFKKGGSIYQDGKETPDPTGTTQGESRNAVQLSQEDMQQMSDGAFKNANPADVVRFKQSKAGHMNARQAERAAIINRLMNSKDQQMQMQQAMQQKQMMEQLKLMEVRNQMLQQQNQLLNTKMQKQDMIDQARTIPSNLQKAMTSPKKRGGSNGKKRGKTMVVSSNMGTMKRGGSCGLPGGRHDRKKR